MGLLPVPEIQYLAYIHNALDQVRGEACSLQFFSNNQYHNGMVMRIASLAYQKGFGGHFHNDNSITALRDIPSLIIACPSRGDDAVSMLRTCTALARTNGRVVAYLEPIALYMTKDLHNARDGEWTFNYPENSEENYIPLGEPRRYSSEAKDLLIISYGNGVPMSLRVAKKLENEHSIQCSILDLRWLKPLNSDAIITATKDYQHVLVVDEGRETGSISEELFTLLSEQLPEIHKTRITGKDSFIPLGDAANTVLVSEEEIFNSAMSCLENRKN